MCQLCDKRTPNEPDGNQPHLGIGNDGKFVLGELCNFLGRCYKMIVLDENQGGKI